MIATIESLRYDTDRAELVHARDNGRHPDDGRYRYKALYVDGRGLWFIHHRGGAHTDMALDDGNQLHGSESIEPITAANAARFLEGSGAYEQLAAYFPEMVSP
jgi:hypothetical protein